MKKVLLCILDGVGLRDEEFGNAVKNAEMPNFNYLWNNYSHSTLEASSQAVGLPDGQMGNSEVGHGTIGTGRVTFQSLEKINQSINDGSFYRNSELLKAIEYAKNNNSNLHLIGLLSDGGIHSNINHLFSLLELCKRQDFTRVFIHVITDGRDTAPDSGISFIKMLSNKISELGVGKIATLCGRYYMMDRDNRFERVKKAYEMLVNGIGDKYQSADDAWKVNQKNGITDEFMKPSIIDENGMINDGDSVVTFNFRPDRLRELYAALSNLNFECFERKILNDLHVVTMMPVSDEVICHNAFSLDEIENTLGEVIAKNGLKQLRIAETEKYAHVTYFFDGGKELELPGCTRVLIPSPKVETYDLVPGMSAEEITDNLLKELTKKPDLVVLNYANGDMVGHTGVYLQGIKAMEVVDKCLGRIIDNINLDEYTILITADHGNCEEMINEDGSVNTAHTTNKVPLILVDKDNREVINGGLSDVAPTILKIMNLDIPKEMTGKILIKNN